MSMPEKIRLDDFIIGLIVRFFYSEIEEKLCCIKYYYNSNPSFEKDKNRLHIKFDRVEFGKGILSSKVNKPLVRIKDIILKCEKHLNHRCIIDERRMNLCISLSAHERMEMDDRINSILKYYNVLEF